MKKKIIYSIGAAVLSAVFLLNVSPALAKSAMSAKYYSEKGKKYYDEGNFEDAAKEFSKALLMDPENSESLEYLKKMGLDEGFYGTNKSVERQAASLGQELAIYKEKLAVLMDEHLKQDELCDELQADNEELCSSIEAKEDEVAFLKTKIGMVEQNLKAKAALNEQKVGQLEFDNKDKQREVKLYKRTAKKQIDLVDDMEGLVMQKDERIMELEDQVEMVKNNAWNELEEFEGRLNLLIDEHNRKLKVYKTQMSRVENDHDESEKALKKIIKSLQTKINNEEEQISTLKNALSDKDRKIAKLQNNKPEADLLKQKDEYIAGLKERLVALIDRVEELEGQAGPANDDAVKSMMIKIDELNEKIQDRDFVLLEKSNEANLLEQRLADAHERLGLVEDVVAEKDVRISELESQLTEIRDQCVE